MRYGSWPKDLNSKKKEFFKALAQIIPLCSGCSNSTVMEPKKFTDEYADHLRQLAPAAKVEIVKDLELKVAPPGRSDFTVFLDNAYNEYKQNPQLKEDVIKKFAASALETIDYHKSNPLDRTNIVAIVKDRQWLEDTRQTLITRGAKEFPETVHEDLNSDLIILYAEDTEKNMRYVSPKDLEKAHINRSELRTLAMENLRRVIPKIEQHGTNGLYMLTAGGDYEASLLLFDSIWSGLKNSVQGDVVVAVPTRDLLIVTGSDDAQGIDKMKQIIQQAWSGGPYQLTQKLFVYRAGKFNEFFPEN